MTTTATSPKRSRDTRRQVGKSDRTSRCRLRATTRYWITPEAATPAPLLRFATSNAPPSVEALPGRLQLPALRLARSLSRSAIPRADVDAAPVAEMPEIGEEEGQGHRDGAALLSPRRGYAGRAQGVSDRQPRGVGEPLSGESVKAQVDLVAEAVDRRVRSAAGGKLPRPGLGPAGRTVRLRLGPRVNAG